MVDMTLICKPCTIIHGIHAWDSHPVLRDRNCIPGVLLYPPIMPVTTAASMCGPCDTAQPISGPCDTTQPISGPGDTAQPISGPCDTTQPISGPCDTTQPISGLCFCNV